MGREASWYGLNMLPIYEEMLIDQLNESMARLNRLKDMKENVEKQFDREMLQVLKIQVNQIKDNWVFFDQCRAWREQNPSPDELKSIASVEKNAYALEKVNDEIIALSKLYKKMD